MQGEADLAWSVICAMSFCLDIILRSLCFLRTPLAPTSHPHKQSRFKPSPSKPTSSWPRAHRPLSGPTLTRHQAWLQVWSSFRLRSTSMFSTHCTHGTTDSAYRPGRAAWHGSRTCSSLSLRGRCSLVSRFHSAVRSRSRRMERRAAMKLVRSQMTLCRSTCDGHRGEAVSAVASRAPWTAAAHAQNDVWDLRERCGRTSEVSTWMNSCACVRRQ